MAISLKANIIERYPFLFARFGFVLDERTVKMVMWAKSEHVTLSFEYGPRDQFTIEVQGAGGPSYNICLFRDLVDDTEVLSFFNDDNDAADFLKRAYPRIRDLLKPASIQGTEKKLEQLINRFNEKNK